MHAYWRLVRSVRVGRKVVQQTVAHLGELGAQGRALRLDEPLERLLPGEREAVPRAAMAAVLVLGPLG